MTPEESWGRQKPQEPTPQNPTPCVPFAVYLSDIDYARTDAAQYGTLAHSPYCPFCSLQHLEKLHGGE